MAWTPSGSILLTSDWQYTEPIPTGSFFRLRHSEAPNGGLFALAQCEIDADGKLSLIDSQVLAVEKPITDVLQFPFPGCFAERRIAIKKLPRQPSLQQELRRLFLPGYLQPTEEEIRIVSRSNWTVDVEVSNFVEPTVTVDLSAINTKIDTISSQISALQDSGGGSTTTPPATTSKTLTYASDGDTNGACYWIGTNYGTEAWVNPHTANRVTVTVVNRNIDCGDGEVVVDRSDSNALSNSGNALAQPLDGLGIIAIDLGIDNSLNCNYYSIRSRGSFPDSFPRSWKLQASSDNFAWVDLDEQINNTTINNTGQWLSLPAVSSSSYRYLRIVVSTATVSARCCLSEFEFYGTLTSTN